MLVSGDSISAIPVEDRMSYALEKTTVSTSVEQNGIETSAIRWHHQSLCVYGASPFCSQGKKVVYYMLYYMP